MSTRLFPAAAYSLRPEKTRIWSRWLGVCLALIVLPTAISLAEITAAGDVDPADPATWTSDTDGYIGNTTTGLLRVDADSDLFSHNSWLGYSSGSTGEMTVDGAGSTWANSVYLIVGNEGSGTLNITNGGAVNNSYGIISYQAGSTSKVTVDGPGSIWANSQFLDVGLAGSGMLTVKNGGTLNSVTSYIGRHNFNTESSWVTVEGKGATWNNSDMLYVGFKGDGVLNISNGGLVRVGGALCILCDSVVNMSTGGILALKGDADDSLAAFMDLIYGSDAIRYWDDSAAGWADITNATYGEDYTLAYLTEGDLAGYTLLTVVPEPATLSLLILAGIGLFRRR